MATKTCSVPGCVGQRKVGKNGHIYALCDEHFREYWRRNQSGDWDGWTGNKRGARKPGKSICNVPDCNKPRMVSRTGQALTMCEEHQRAYWRSMKPPKGDATGTTTKRGRKPKTDAAALEPAQIKLRVVAVCCDVCSIKLPYTDEHFDIAAKSRTCRHCADAQILTVVNPLNNTAQRVRVVGGDKIVSCGDGAEAYAAFARAEADAGNIVVITW